MISYATDLMTLKSWKFEWKFIIEGQIYNVKWFHLSLFLSLLGNAAQCQLGGGANRCKYNVWWGVGTRILRNWLQNGAGGTWAPGEPGKLEFF